MKRILIILLVLIVLGGGGAGASIFLKIGPLPAMLGMVPKTPVAPPPPPPPPPHKEIPVNSFAIPVVQDHGITRSLGLDIVLDVLAADEPKVTPLLPRVINDFTLTLYEVVPNHSDAHSPADKKFIHDRLVLAEQKIYGKDLIKDVVIKSIYDH